MGIDQTDRKLMDLMQQYFPLTATPWQQLAKQLQLEEEEVIARVKRLRESGMIHRIGGVLDTKTMSYDSCLCAMCVPANRMKAIAEAISRHPGVTHNYELEGTYNLWFTLVSDNEEARKKRLKAWEYQFKLPIQCFPVEKIYKRWTQFAMQQGGE